MGEIVGCGGGELAMCAERPGPDVSTAEILPSKEEVVKTRQRNT